MCTGGLPHRAPRRTLPVSTEGGKYSVLGSVNVAAAGDTCDTVPLGGVLRWNPVCSFDF